MDIAPGKGCCALLLCLVIRYALLRCFPTASLSSHLGAQQGVQIGIPNCCGSCSSYGALRSFNFMPSLQEYQAGRPFGLGAVNFFGLFCFDVWLWLWLCLFACRLVAPSLLLSVKANCHHYHDDGPNRISNCVLLERLLRSFWPSTSGYRIILGIVSLFILSRPGIYGYSVLCTLSRFLLYSLKPPSGHPPSLPQLALQHMGWPSVR